MKYFGEALKQFPYNLENLIIELYLYNLGENKENMKYFRDGLGKLPNSLRKLKLKLYCN